MHVSPLFLGVAIATSSVTAAALPRGRSRSRVHSAATFLKLRSPPAPNVAAERFVILPEDAVQTEKRDIASADVYHRPTAGDDSAAVHVSTDSINTSSGKNTQQPDLGLDESSSSAIVESLIATTLPFETFTYSNYAPASTSSSSVVPEPSVTASVDAVQEALKAAESYALKQQNVALPTVTVHLVMEPTQEADGTWDYVVKVGADGTATASPTWVSSSTATPTTSSAADYYVPSATTLFTPEPSASIVGEQSAPNQSSAEASTSSSYYGNTHTWNGTPHANSSLSIETEHPIPVIDSAIRTLLTTSSHFAFQCADATSYYYSDETDATQVCPGGTVCRFVDTACSPCVWPDQDIWCAGKIYPFIEPAATSSAQVQPSVTTQAPAASVTPTEVVTGSGYQSVVGETGRSAVTFTYTTSNVAVPTVAPVPTTTDMPASSPTSYVYGSGYASASGETGRSAVTFTYSSSAIVSSAESAETTAWTSGHGGQHSYPWMTASAEPSTTEPAVTAAPAESTAWTSGHGGQHSYPWMTESAESSQMVPSATASSADSAIPTSLVETVTTLSNGVVTATLAPASSSSSIWESASTTVNSWLVEATKGPNPIQSGVFSSVGSSTASTQPTQSVTESASASSTGSASFSTESSSLISEPVPTSAFSEFPTNATVPTPSNVETATATDSVFAPTSTQSANGENATATWASSSSGILVPTSAVENGTAIATASITSQASEPALTASASVSDPSDNGIATETVTDWDIVNATSTTYVPYETASATATYTVSENSTVWPTAMPTVNATTAILPTSTDALNVSISTVETASAMPTGTFTSPIVNEWPANETTTASATEGLPSVAPTASVSSTQSAWESVVTASETYVSSTASQSSESGFPTGSASSTQSSWESVITASETEASSTASQNTESTVATATATSSAPASTETGSDEDECEEWEEVWVDERDIQDDWIIVE